MAERWPVWPAAYSYYIHFGTQCKTPEKSLAAGPLSQTPGRLGRGYTSPNPTRLARRLHYRAFSTRLGVYVSKPSAIGQPTRPTQPFILSGSINE